MIGGLVGALEWLKDAKRCWLNENNCTIHIREADLHMKEINKVIYGHVGYRAIEEKRIRAKAIDDFAEKLRIACSENTCNVTINGMKNVDILTLDSVTEVIEDVAKRMKGVSE